jgi:acetyl-CoA synthetase
VESEHPLFVLYTSGSTGKPKGVLHTVGGYMVYAATTAKYVFDLHPDLGDVFFCTADCGWITGHTYVAYGPLLNRATQLVFEGVPSHPDPGRLWRIVDKYAVSQLYTAPTAIRALMRHGDEPVLGTSRASLRLLGSVSVLGGGAWHRRALSTQLLGELWHSGSAKFDCQASARLGEVDFRLGRGQVGEPIGVEAWRWYHAVVGGGRCPVIDTWWQTETGTSRSRFI